MEVDWIKDGEEVHTVPISVFWYDDKMWAVVATQGETPIILQIEKKDLSPHYYGWTP